MIGDDVFDVLFTSSLKTKDLGNLKGIVTLISYFVPMLEYDRFVGKRMGGFHPDIMQSQLRKLFTCFGFRISVESQVENSASARTAACILVRYGCLSGLGHSIVFVDC